MADAQAAISSLGRWAHGGRRCGGCTSYACLLGQPLLLAPNPLPPLNLRRTCSAAWAAPKLTALMRAADKLLPQQKR